LYTVDINRKGTRRSNEMKRMVLAVSVLVVAVLALSVTVPALAAGPSQGGPGTNNPDGRSYANKMDRQGVTRGEGIMEYQRLLRNEEIKLDGLLEDIIHEELALALEVSPSELADRLADGESMIDIAFSLGLDSEAVEDLMADVRMIALEEAVELQLISQEQADWLASRGFGNPSFETGLDCRVD
jgi:hypothetical protein